MRRLSDSLVEIGVSIRAHYFASRNIHAHLHYKDLSVLDREMVGRARSAMILPINVHLPGSTMAVWGTHLVPEGRILVSWGDGSGSVTRLVHYYTDRGLPDVSPRDFEAGIHYGFDTIVESLPEPVNGGPYRSDGHFAARMRRRRGSVEKVRMGGLLPRRGGEVPDSTWYLYAWNVLGLVFGDATERGWVPLAGPDKTEARMIVDRVTKA